MVKINIRKLGKFLVGASIGAGLYFASYAAHAADKPPAGMKPLATCADGKTEYSATGDHRGACSGHGGVKAWADGSPVKSHAKRTEYK